MAMSGGNFGDLVYMLLVYKKYESAQKEERKKSGYHVAFGDLQKSGYAVTCGWHPPQF